jgi:hypothetical protein
MVSEYAEFQSAGRVPSTRARKPRAAQRSKGGSGLRRNSRTRGTHVHAREHARGTRIYAAPATTASARCRRRPGSAGSMPDGSSSTISERRRTATQRSLSVSSSWFKATCLTMPAEGDADMQDAKVRLCANEVLGDGLALAWSVHAGGGMRIRGALPSRLARETRGGGGRETAGRGITA